MEGTVNRDKDLHRLYDVLSPGTATYLAHIYKPRCMIKLVNHSTANDYRNYEKEELHSSNPFVSIC
jgi:hypothetical protein